MKSAISLLAKTEIFFYSILYLIILLVIGTISQKYIGLYLAQEKFFSSFIVWFYRFIPLPGGYVVMGIIFINLLAKLALEKFEIKKIGTIIIHVGVLMILAGGFITAVFSYEGNMIIREGQSKNYISDYNVYELAILEEGEDVALFGQKQLEEGALLNNSQIPFTINVTKYYKNVELVSRQSLPEKHQLRGGALMYYFNALPMAKEHEENMPAIDFRVTGAEAEDGDYSIFKSLPIEQTIGKYVIELRNKRIALPFQIQLIDFKKTSYPGTTKAQNYQSKVILKDGDLEWKSLIEMNQPLRYKGYTLFQSSFMDDGSEEISVLAVVKNAGRIFPYISSIIICIGLLGHLFMRRVRR